MHTRAYSWIRYNSKPRWLLIAITALFGLKLFFMTSNVVQVKNRLSYAYYCNCEERKHVPEKVAPYTRDVPDHDIITKDGMTLLSEDPNTTHTWPYGGKDLRKQCLLKNWYKLGPLPSTSVIITFIDREGLVTLLRTVHSVIKHTPEALLKEIILVEDNCQREDLHSVLDVYIKAIYGDKVSVIRNNQSLGLIKARLQGIRAAKGEVVVCMDSHVEVTPLWLEPLLYEIKSNRRTMASSFLDWIEFKGGRCQYRHGGSNWKTYFDMNLVFGFQQVSTWQERRRESQISAIDCPVTVGTVWAIDKQHFTEIGEFDEGMEFWGGENLDLPVRVWLFGGRVVNVPCSHAAHLEKAGYRSYRENREATIHRNYKRFTTVWMREFQPYFDPYFPDFKIIETGDLTSRKALRKKAHHEFSWLLNNVFPELGVPQIHGKAWGRLTNMATRKCLTEYGFSVYMDKCFETSHQMFFLSRDKSELRSTIDVYNLKRKKVKDGGGSLSKTGYITVYNANTSTVWTHSKNGPLKILSENLCLEQLLQDVIITRCDPNNRKQRWYFDQYAPSLQKRQMVTVTDIREPQRPRVGDSHKPLK